MMTGEKALSSSRRPHVEKAYLARVIGSCAVIACAPLLALANDGPQVEAQSDLPERRCATDQQCDDGNFCNGTERCVGGFCNDGIPPCNDHVDCTADTCDEDADSCQYDPDHAFCDDMLFCNGAEVCDLTAGCRSGPPRDCDDGVSCTVDACDEEGKRCVHTPDDALCNDGLFCNGGETCDRANDCQAGLQPCGAPGLPYCDENLDRCVNCLLASHCDDGVFCNGPEQCVGGDCHPSGDPCDDGVACTADVCDEAEDTCTNILDDYLCRDQSPCMLAICDPSSIDADVDGCRFALISCNDISDCPEGAVACGHRVCLCFGGPIPTVTTWGLLVMVLLGLSAGTIVFSRSRAALPAET